MAEQFLTAAEVSAELQIPEKTLAQYRYQGRGPRWHKLEGQVRYLRSELNAWAESCRRGGQGAA